MSKGFGSSDPRSEKFKARLIKAIKSRDSDRLDATINWGCKQLGEKILTEIIINLHLDSPIDGFSEEEAEFYWSWTERNVKAAEAWKEACDISKSNLVDSLTKQGLILGKDFSIGAKGELIMSEQTTQKVSEMIPDYHDKISFHEQLKSIENNISLKEMATNTGANPDYFQRLFIRAKRRLEPYIMADDGYFFWHYNINFIEGTEIKFPELKDTDFDKYVLEQVASPTALKHLWKNADNYPIPPEDEQYKALEYLLQDIVEAASIGQTEEIIEHEGKRLMSINTFRILGKVWDSEKMPTREMICLLEQHSRKK